ncbi:MAG: hypothetical protein ACKOLA_16380 [Spartobacteria bacterium]
MKLQAATLIAAVAALALHTGCERHPASQTVPGYAEKMKEKQAQAEQAAGHSEAADPNAPSYFPPKNH